MFSALRVPVKRSPTPRKTPFYSTLGGSNDSALRRSDMQFLAALREKRLSVLLMILGKAIMEGERCTIPAWKLAAMRVAIRRRSAMGEDPN